jgi:hypothetical protein
MLSPAKGKQDTDYSAAEIKAAFLLSFLRYAEFPKSTFASAEAPIVIGVVGEDVFGEALAQLEGYVCRGRPIVIRHFKTTQETEICHLVFLSNQGETDEQKRYVASLKTQPTIIVCERGELLKAGATIALRLIKGRMRFDINLKAANAAGISFNSRMLELANTIH